MKQSASLLAVLGLDQAGANQAGRAGCVESGCHRHLKPTV